MTKKKKRRFLPRFLVAAAAVILTACVGCGIYLGSYYHADSLALESIEQPADGVTVSREDDRIIFAPEEPRAGLIFYPGGKVQYEAYAPLMEACAEEGLLCILLHMPGNLAVLDINAADGIQEEYPEIHTWYMGGHSLGGSMAASYVSSHAEDYEGLILLASYSTEDLSDSGLKVLSIYGSEDGVLKMDSYEKYKTNLPSDFSEVILAGGCHAYFGCYGAQKGDGMPTISNKEQIRLTAEAIGQSTGTAAEQNKI